MKYVPFIVIVSLLFMLQSCDLLDSISKKEELPPVTQEGKNTFGCYVNGKLWLPRGRAGLSGPLDASYDPDFAGGSFDIATHRLLSDTEESYLYLYMSGLTAEGTYDLADPNIGAATFMTLTPSCDYSRDPTTYRRGALSITNFDLSSQIVSGTFEFTLASTDCDTIKVTDGRFDMKF
jgi:hypothetical protein